MAIFKGAGVAITTPFKENGEVDYHVFRDQIEYQIANGTDAIIVCGTTGESSTLSHREHIDCIKAVVDYTKKRIPVIAGTGSNSTDEAVYLSEKAKDCGADALLLVSPYYNKATQNGLKAHFKAVADSVDLPIILYNIKGRTGINIAPRTVAEMYKEIDNIVAIKEASGDISQVAEIMNLTDGKIDLYSGNDDQIVPILSLGGKGVISVLSNVVPKETHDIVECFLKGDTKKSLEIQLKYLPLIHALFSEVNPIPVKKALEFMGFEAGPLRLPLTEMEEAHAAKLKREMVKVGLVAE